MDDKIRLENRQWTFSFALKGQPKDRPRFEQGRIRTPERTRKFESALGQLLRFKLPKPWEPLLGPIEIHLEFHFIKPKSSKRVEHTTAPDLDNLIKAVSDAFNGIMWKDDSQIISIVAKKFYSNNRDWINFTCIEI